MIIKELNKYTTILDEIDLNIIDQNIQDKGVEGFLNKQLVYLDCSRIINDMRVMQTVGYPYQREISRYLYVLDLIEDDSIKQDYINRLIDLHNRNLAFESENPPIIYKRNTKDKSNKLPRRRTSTKETLAKADKQLSNAERLKKLTANFGPLTFKIKPFKKD